MAQSVTARAEQRAVAETRAIPWYVWCSVIAVTSAMVGAHWDISWHMSIGRDTFWTPAHMAIYFCGVLAGISCGYLIFSTSLGHDQAAREASVKVWGFQGPLGAFIAAWGGVAMLTSAPFDNWWHSAYGLDVKVISPPHVLLITGVLTVQLGALILILGAMNRAQGALRGRLDWLFLYVGGMIIVQVCILTWERSWRSAMHSASFYRAVALSIPLVLVGISRASQRRWAATAVTVIYTAFWAGALWILPLFPAQPKLGPVYQKVTHFVPMGFPLLLVGPAVVLDLLWPKIKDWKNWLQAVVAGFAFLGSFMAMQWPFAGFLMSPAARNRLFGTRYFAYADHAGFLYDPYRFYPQEKTRAEFWVGMGVALVAAVVMTRLGLAWGEWMRRIRR
jgi:hypothetical protein